MKRIILILIVLMSLIVLNGCSEPNYYYKGTIVDIEGGSSRSLIILTLDNGQKTPYTTQSKCSNLIRLGQKVYSSLDNNYLWVEYETGKFC